jgi:hypothetical protein
MQRRVPGLVVAARALAGCSLAMGNTGAPAGQQAGTLSCLTGCLFPPVPGNAEQVAREISVLESQHALLPRERI